MQEYFPKESQEVRFTDDSTGEIHIADVFLAESNTVLEFQHSPISWDEFWSRTQFHVVNGRRIAWLFDESSKADKSYGRFQPDELRYEPWPYNDRCYKWIRQPRKILSNLSPEIFGCFDRISICVYTGTEGDLFHRIVGFFEKFKSVVFSVHNIQMTQDVNADEFFESEQYWLNQEPWKTRISNLQKIQRQFVIQPIQFIPSTFRFTNGRRKNRRR